MKSEPAQAKAALRAQFAAYREALSSKERARRSEQIAARLWALPEIQSARVVHCYWPLARHGEIDTCAFIERLYASGRTVALPVVTSFEKKAPAMAARRYEGPDCLRENRWGLAEPAATEAVPPEALEAVVVPAFGAGRRGGHRIGHGRGFYDAFLANVDAPAAALVYDACLAARVPSAPHDIPMDALVAETETVRPAP